MFSKPDILKKSFLPEAFICKPVILFAGVFALSLLLIAANSSDPAAGIRAFFAGPWDGVWFFGNTLDGISLLLTASLGTAIAFQAGCFNLGSEGQVYIGGLAGAVVLMAFEGQALSLPFPVPSPLSGFFSLLVAAFAALAAGGVMGLICGMLKRLAGANEIITSFLLSAGLMPVADFLISGPLRAKSGNLLAMPPLPDHRLLLRILPPSNLSVSCVFALLLVIAGHVFMTRTKWGFELKIAGSAPAFARYAGINAERFWAPAMAVSGALSALAGFFAVAGTYGRCHAGFSGGLGWNAIAVALIAGNRPLALIPAALVYGALTSGSDAAMLATGLSVETAAFIQAAVLLLATTEFARRVKHRAVK